MNTLENRNAAAQEKRFYLSSIAGALIGGAARGYALKKNPTLAGFGPGGKLHIDHVLALGGLMVGRKRSRTGAIARGVGLMALGQIGNAQGERAADEI